MAAFAAAWSTIGGGDLERSSAPGWVAEAEDDVGNEERGYDDADDYQGDEERKVGGLGSWTAVQGTSGPGMLAEGRSVAHVTVTVSVTVANSVTVAVLFAGSSDSALVQTVNVPTMLLVAHPVVTARRSIRNK